MEREREREENGERRERERERKREREKEGGLCEREERLHVIGLLPMYLL